MQRREFMTLIGAAGVAWPLQAQGLTASAQPSAAPVIGFIHSASPSYFAQFASAVRDGLKEAGYIEGRNVTIEYRWAEGHYERLPALVADLVERQVAEIFAAGGTDPAKAAKAATSVIPIIFISAADPVGARPGCKPQQAGRQHNGCEPARLGARRQEARTVARPGARGRDDRRRDQSGLSRRDRAVRRIPGGGRPPGRATAGVPRPQRRRDRGGVRAPA